MMTIPKRGPGRPSLQPEERKARNLTFRSRGDLYERLREAAELNERSISEEIGARLEASFLEDRPTDTTNVERNAMAFEWMLGRNGAATDLLGKIVFLLQSHPGWDESRAMRKAIADQIHAYAFPNFDGDK